MPFDYQIFKLINDLAGQHPWLDAMAIFLTNKIGYIAIAFLILIFLISLKNRKDWAKNLKIWLFWPILPAGISRLIIANIIRFFYFRPRPFLIHDVHQLISHSANENSFPSGHASFYFALATAIYLTNKKIGIIYLIIASLIGISRVFSGIHYPLDILGGALIGIFTAITVYRIKKHQK